MARCRSWAALFLAQWLAAGAQAEGTPEAGPEPEPDETIVEATTRGDAITETAAPGWHYPKAYASRPLTMNKFMIRGTFIVTTRRAVSESSAGTLSSRPLISIDLGAAFSPIDNLEVGISNYRLGSTGPTAGQAMFPIVVSPIGAFGDMPLYARYSFLRKDYVEMALDVVLNIPSWTNLAATFGLPTRIRVRDTVTIDTGTELVVLSNGAGMNVELPFKFTYNIRPTGFIFGSSGFSFQNLARNLTGGSFNDSSLVFPVARNQVLVPLAVGGGYTHVLKDMVMLDVFAQFGWNPFVYVNPPSGSGIGTVPVADSWMLSVGVVIHTSPILQE